MSKTTTALAVLALTGGGLLASSSTAGAACAPGYVASKNTCIKIPLPTGTDASRSATTDVATFLEAVGGHRCSPAAASSGSGRPPRASTRSRSATTRRRRRS